MNKDKKPLGASPKQKAAIESGQAKEWPHNNALHGLDLNGVISNLEQTFIGSLPNPAFGKEQLLLKQKIADVIGVSYEPTNRDLYRNLVVELPDELTFSEKLSEVMPVVWTDYRLWQIFFMKPPTSAVLKDALVAFWLLNHYNLQIPFRDSVWLELRRWPSKVPYLILLMSSLADRFFHLGATSMKNEMAEGDRLLLNELFLGKLLHKYVVHPLNDWRPLVQQTAYPPQVLRRLCQAADQLAKDAAWVAKNPTRYLLQRAPISGHRIRSLKEAKAIEEMVAHIRCDPRISDYALAKKGMGRITAAGRKLAKEAKLLAFYRDNLPVKVHKSRGDKTTPQTST